MPSIVAHAVYGDIAVTRTGDSAITQAIKANHDLFWIGCQGPDLFFYYHPWSGRAYDRQVRGYPERLHGHKIDMTFTLMAAQAKKEADMAVTAYVAGFLSHWAMDMNCHPYIFYRTQRPEKQDGYPEHQFLEAAIDRAVLQDQGLDLAAYSILDRRPGCDAKIHAVLQQVMAAEYGLDLPLATVSAAISDFRFVERFFYSRGAKFRFYRGLEKLVGKPKAITALIIPPDTDPDVDPLNTRHAVWHDPCDRSVVSTASFAELADRAVGQTADLWAALQSYLQDEGPVEDLTRLLAGRTFKTGRDEQDRMYCFAAGDRS